MAAGVVINRHLMCIVLQKDQPLDIAPPIFQYSSIDQSAGVTDQQIHVAIRWNHAHCLINQ
jgi:hypothetical protein